MGVQARARRALAVILFALCVSDLHALTLSDIRTAIRRNVRDTAQATTGRRYSDAVLLAYINEAQRSVINDTWALSASSSAVSVAGSGDLNLPSTTIEVWRVSYNYIALPELDIRQIDADNDDSSWTTSTGTPVGFWTIRSDPTVIHLYPAPIVSNDQVSFNYFHRATDLSNDSDVPYDGNLRLYSYHDLLIYLATYRILIQENRLDEADRYKEFFVNGLDVMNTNVGNKPERPIKSSKEVTP